MHRQNEYLEEHYYTEKQQERTEQGQWVQTMGSLEWQVLSGLICDTVGINTKGKAPEQGNDHKKCLKELNPITV